MRIDLPLHRVTLLRRYKRFLADVRFEDGRELTVHCPNSGSMMGLAAPGIPALVSDSQNDKRKLRFTLERVKPGRAWVGVNTMLPNHLVEDAVRRGRIGELLGYDEIRREATYEKGTRFDLLLTAADRSRCWIEVKNATLAVGREARFPDAVTERGRKHLDTLARVAADGERAVMCFVVNRADCDRLAPADEIDPAYGAALRSAAEAGVELLAYRTRTRGPAVTLNSSLPIEL